MKLKLKLKTISFALSFSCAAMLLAAIPFVFASCGGGSADVSNAHNGGGDAQAEVNAAPVDAAAKLAKLDAELAALDAPADVDPSVFETLKREFQSEVERLAREGELRTSSAPPAGSAGMVVDLNVEFLDNAIFWTYVNPGDYSADGEVGIPDITPIAQNYLARLARTAFSHRHCLLDHGLK